RPPIEERFLRLAEWWAQWSTCAVKHGAVIFDGNVPIGEGYNGSSPGEPHCVDVGCLIQRGHCVRTIHAEDNAIRRALERGMKDRLRGATIAITGSPCPDCQERIKEAGIARVIYRVAYRGVRPMVD